MALVYRHRRLDTNEIFYIGIGSSKQRVNKKQSRNKYWHNITNKTKWCSEILINNITNEEAEELEIFLIKLYGRKKDGGKLCNITKGGKGLTGYKYTQEQKDKVSKRMKGHTVTKETREKIRKSHLGKKLSKYHIEKLRKSNLNKIVLLETRLKTSKAVLKLDMNNKIIEEYYSIREASRKNNISAGHISKVCNNIRKTAGKFKWKYKL